MRVARRVRAFNISAVCVALSAIALGHTLQISNGFYSPKALAWLSVAFGLAVFGGCLSRLTPTLSRGSVAVVTAVLGVGLAWQLQQLVVSPPGFYIRAGANMGIFRAAILVQAICIAIGFLRIQPLRRIWFPAVLVASLWLGVWMIRASPEPYIDVVVVHKEAIEALLKHKDPYLISFVNVYEDVDAQKFYNPAALIGGRVAFAYPYPPPSLLLAAPGHVLFGDYRYAELFLLVAAAGLIGYARRGAVAKLAACLLLTTPRVWFVIEQGWTEPIAVFLLALTVFLLVRHPVAAAWAGGIFLVTKQYLVFTGLAVARLVFTRRQRWFWIGFGMVFASAAVTLPFALWHPHAFMRNVVWLQAQEPFRPDSLSYLAWAARNGLGNGSFVWAVSAAVAAAILSLAATRNSPAGFAASVALTTFTTFVFGSKAFCNYYFFVVGALCSALAALPRTDDEAPVGD